MRELFANMNKTTLRTFHTAYYMMVKLILRIHQKLTIEHTSVTLLIRTNVV